MLKPGEERLANFYLRLQPDALLIRSAGMLQHMTALRSHGTQTQRSVVAACCKLVVACALSGRETVHVRRKEQ